MNKYNLDVLTNIIGAVESGGQVYGKRRYDAYDPPYKNSPKEHTITIGWAQCYGHEARQLLQAIYEADPVSFIRLDTSDIEEMLSYDWVAIRWKPSSKEKAAIIALIDSPVGHAVQDRLFEEKMQKLVADCMSDYPEADIKAQMMYCEIRHLGGRGPCDRIFRRCKGKYDLDTIMAALVADQKDTSSSNQVGDKIYWSRHLKCRQFIDQYAQPEPENAENGSKVPGTDENVPDKTTDDSKEVKTMAVIIGSARGDEYGGSGWDGRAKAGDQKQTSADDWKGEVSKQNWYLHSKGWYVFRAKDPAKREKLALNTEYACANPNVGYDQSQNRTMLSYAKKVDYDVSKIASPCETDCGQLQYNGCWFAGIKIEDFYTANMKEKIEKTGEFYVFTDDAHCKSSTRLLRGDLLCTRSKGHIVCVLSDGSKAAEERAKYDGEAAPEPAPTPSSNYNTVKEFQKFLNRNYAQIIKSYCGALLTVDGDYGAKSRAAAVTVWKYMANKYYGGKLTLGNMNFFESAKAVSAKMTDAEVAKHPTLGYLIQGILAGKGYYSAKLDGVCGAKTEAAVKKLQKAKGLSETGKMSADTWYILFNN